MLDDFSLFTIASGVVLFLLVSVALYFAADWILKRAEARAGRRFEHRSFIFFGLLLSLALLTFAILRTLLRSQ